MHIIVLMRPGWLDGSPLCWMCMLYSVLNTLLSSLLLRISCPKLRNALRICTKNTLQQKLLPSLKMPTLAPIRLSNTSAAYNQLDLIIVIKCEKTTYQSTHKNLHNNKILSMQCLPYETKEITSKWQLLCIHIQISVPNTLNSPIKKIMDNDSK